MLALKAANEALVARVAVLEAGVKSKSEKKVVGKGFADHTDLHGPRTTDLHGRTTDLHGLSTRAFHHNQSRWIPPL